mgnify:CR=1 FL=1
MAKPLRILTFLHSFEPGGVERVALRLVQAWRDGGHDALLLFGRRAGAMRREWPDLDYRVLAERGWFIRHMETLWMILRLPGEIRRCRPDVLFCAGNTYAIVAVAMKLRLGRRCPPIVAKISNDLDRRDLPGPARWAYRLWLRIQGRAIDRFVGMALPMADEIATAMKVSKCNIEIVNDPAIRAADIVEGRPIRLGDVDPSMGTRFISVGRLVAQKNHRLMIRAFADVARSNDELVILGDGPERKSLERLIATLGMEDRIFLPGHVNPITDRLRASDLFVLSSDYEGVPAAIIEALACGLPIVATDCSVSMASLLDHGRLGALVPVGSQRALATAMCDARDRVYSPAAARIQARNFTVESASAGYIAVFRRAVDAHRTGLADPEIISPMVDATFEKPRRLN